MKIQTVKITNLLLSVENPRFEKVESQREAIDIMVGEQRDPPEGVFARPLDRGYGIIKLRNNPNPNRPGSEP